MAHSAIQASTPAYSDSTETHPRGSTAALTALAGAFGRVRESFAAWRRRNATIRELSMLTDRELNDIGISRYDIPFVATTANTRRMTKAQAEAGMI